MGWWLGSGYTFHARPRIGEYGWGSSSVGEVTFTLAAYMYVAKVYTPSFLNVEGEQVVIVPLSFNPRCGSRLLLMHR